MHPERVRQVAIETDISKRQRSESSPLADVGLGLFREPRPTSASGLSASLHH